MNGPAARSAAAARCRLIAQRDLPWDLLPARRRILCFSDTHLLPFERLLGDDMPELVLGVLRSFEDHEIVALGDLTESLVVSRSRMDEFVTSPRLAAIWSELRARLTAFVPGNHDARALAQLTRIFGVDRVKPGGFRDGPLQFRHGHESDATWSPSYAYLARVGVPMLVTLERVGIRGSVMERSNASLVGTREDGVRYVVFGHTHQPTARMTFANCGAIVRGGPRTFVTLESNVVRLWGCGPDVKGGSIG